MFDIDSDSHWLGQKDYTYFEKLYIMNLNVLQHRPQGMSEHDHKTKLERLSLKIISGTSEDFMWSTLPYTII